MKKLYTALSFLALFVANTLCASGAVRVTSENEYNRLANNGRPTVIEFSANWCGVCNGIAKPFEELSSEAEFKDITFARVDIDELPELSEKSDIKGVPTFHFFANGRLKKCDVGVKNMGAFKENFRRCLRETLLTAPKTSDNGVSNDTAEAFEDPEYVGVPERVNQSGGIGMIWQSIHNFFFRLIDFIQGFFNFAINGIKSLFGR
jgi:thioredoxin 1